MKYNKLYFCECLNLGNDYYAHATLVQRVYFSCVAHASTDNQLLISSFILFLRFYDSFLLVKIKKKELFYIKRNRERNFFCVVASKFIKKYVQLLTIFIPILYMLFLFVYLKNKTENYERKTTSPRDRKNFYGHMPKCY